MITRLRRIVEEHSRFTIFILVTMILMVLGIIWVYHVAVLNAPKVYSDGFGYYVYLPAVIFQDFDFTFVERGGWEHPLTLTPVQGGRINKYPVGTAIMESPFFFVAHFVSLVRDTAEGSVTATGYSNLYQYAVLAGGVIYWAIGTIILYRLLIRYVGISKKVSCMTCFFITFGTNLFHYASYDACFSHIYSYTMFILFLYYLCWYEERDKENLNRMWNTCVFGVLAGIIFMIRNTNILFVVTYILYGVKDIMSLKNRIHTVLKPRRVLPIIIAGFVTIIPQVAYWYVATGHLFVYSYGSNEPFYWFSPEIINFLFSVRKGLFFWSPILGVSVVGIFRAYRKRDRLYIGLTVFLLLIIYVSSAWWSWYYGGSYGQRVAVDFMCVFAIFMAYLLNELEMKRSGKTNVGIRKYVAEMIIYGYCGVCVVINCINTLAYWYRIIPWDHATWDDIRAVLEWL